MAESRFFTGEYANALDAKSRVVIPSPLREELGRDFIVCYSIDEPCLWLVPRDDFMQMAQMLQRACDPSDMELRWELRTYIAKAYPGNFDDQGRLTVAPDQRRYAHLTQGAKSVVVSGNIDKIEIWDASVFERGTESAHFAKLAAKYAEIHIRE